MSALNKQQPNYSTYANMPMWGAPTPCKYLSNPNPEFTKPGSLNLLLVLAAENPMEALTLRRRWKSFLRFNPPCTDVHFSKQHPLAEFHLSLLQKHLTTPYCITWVYRVQRFAAMYLNATWQVPDMPWPNYTLSFRAYRGTPPFSVILTIRPKATQFQWWQPVGSLCIDKDPT